MTQWIHDATTHIIQAMPEDSFLNSRMNVYALVAVVLVSLVCGAVGSLVVGNRMAFFSDALAHCAFAGVALGLLAAIFTGAAKGGTFDEVGIPLIMVGFGVVVGVAIAFVRERTSLSNDTVIGVFFAGAIGFGAVLFRWLSVYTSFNPENFLFGNPVTVRPGDLLLLLLVTVVTLVVLGLMYNQLVFASFNPSLARSRNVPLTLCNYLFIALLALIVNLSLKTVGALLINALLIVPAATASNVCRNLRQLFWTSVVLSVAVGVAGLRLSFVEVPLGGTREPLTFGPGGLIVVLSVLLFFVSMAVSPLLRRRAVAKS